MKQGLKRTLGSPLSGALKATRGMRENLRRLYAYASLSADLSHPLPLSVVVLGRALVYGTGNILFGKDVLLYPDLHLETHAEAAIEIGDGVVISRGAHIVAMSGVSIGSGTMIGEYSSIRDANHNREEEIGIRHSGHTALSIQIGKQVWIGRGVTVLAGVHIGDAATIGANSVVTRDVPAGVTVGGAPAVPLKSRVRLQA